VVLKLKLYKLEVIVDSRITVKTAREIRGSK